MSAALTRCLSSKPTVSAWSKRERLSTATPVNLGAVAGAEVGEAGTTRGDVVAVGGAEGWVGIEADGVTPPVHPAVSTTPRTRLAGRRTRFLSGQKTRPRD